VEQFYFQIAGKLNHLMEIVDFIFVRCRVLLLFFENGRCRARMPGVKEHEVVFEPLIAFCGKVHLFHGDSAALLELDEVHTAAGAGVLILFTYGFTKQIDLHMAGLFGYLFLAHVRFVVGIADIDKACRKRR